MRYFLFLLFTVSLFVSVSCKHAMTLENASSKEPLVLKNPDWIKDAVIYEVNVRQFSKEGTFNAFVKSLPRLKEMGVDVIWFMPIHPIGEKGRKMPLGSYYAVKDYKAIGSEYGTTEDFKAVVKQAHGLGMKVLIDWVANHTSWDNAWVSEHPDWFTKDSLGKMMPPVADWTDVVDLNYSNNEMRHAMVDALRFWITEADIDGYRCDVAESVPNDFWNYAVRELQKIKPVFMLAEGEKPELHRNGFNMTYCWTYMGGAYDIAAGKKSADYIDSLLVKENIDLQKGDIKMRFTANHDENSWKGFDKEIFGDNLNAFALLTFTLPGLPLIYSGQEAGLNKRLKFFERDPISWEDLSRASFYKSLTKLKKENKAIWNAEFGGVMERINTNCDKSVYAFSRTKDANEIDVIVNLSNEKQSIKATKIVDGSYTDYFSGLKVDVKNGFSIDLKAHEYLVLIKN